MLYTLGVVVFVLGLLASIALHEVGHMVPAKRFGVKVTQYMIGFGPTLWSRKRGDTEYGIKAIPAGGYIRMIGMVPPRADGARSRWPSRVATAVEEFRSASRSEVVHEADEPRQFYRLTPGKKIVVMLGGPSMNLLIYLVMTVILLTVIGTPKDNTTLTVGSVVKCVVAQNSPDAQKGICPPTAPAAPAAAVLEPGDVIEAINGTAVRSWDDAVAVIQQSAGKTLALTIKRSGVNEVVSITPVENIKYANDSGTKTIRAGYIGVGPQIFTTYPRNSLAQVPGQIGHQLRLAADAVGSYPTKIHSLWETVFEGKARDPNGAVGIVGLGEIGGQLAENQGLQVRTKIFSLLALLAEVNLLLFFFNLLPLLPLDGGHVAGALVEAGKRGRSRLLARRTPAPGGPDGRAGRPRAPIYVDTAQMLPIMYAVASVLIVLTLLVVYADIVKPIHLN